MSEFEQFNVLRAVRSEDTAFLIPEEINLDTALLIAAATAKGIDPSLWLTESVDAGIRPLHDFSTKLTSLSLAVGIREDRDTKRELDHAISKESMRIIYHLCKADKDGNGTLMIDVSLFLRLCNRRILDYVGSLRAEAINGASSNVPSLEPNLPSADLGDRFNSSAYEAKTMVSKASSPILTPNGSPTDLQTLDPPNFESFDDTAANLRDEETYSTSEEDVEKPLNEDSLAAEMTIFSSANTVELPPRHPLPPSNTYAELYTRSANLSASIDSNVSAFSSSKLHQSFSSRRVSTNQLLLSNMDTQRILREVERLLRRMLKQSDLYHILQVLKA